VWVTGVEIISSNPVDSAVEVSLAMTVMEDDSLIVAEVLSEVLSTLSSIVDVTRTSESEIASEDRGTPDSDVREAVVEAVVSGRVSTVDEVISGQARS
jgi:hypothetical protein